MNHVLTPPSAVPASSLRRLACVCSLYTVSQSVTPIKEADGFLLVLLLWRHPWASGCVGQGLHKLLSTEGMVRKDTPVQQVARANIRWTALPMHRPSEVGLRASSPLGTASRSWDSYLPSCMEWDTDKGLMS